MRQEVFIPGVGMVRFCNIPEFELIKIKKFSRPCGVGFSFS